MQNIKNKCDYSLDINDIILKRRISSKNIENENNEIIIEDKKK